MNFVLGKVEICTVCHRVTKCHILYQNKNETILICGICDAE